MKKGFTLIELLIIVSIVGIISAIIIPQVFKLEQEPTVNLNLNEWSCTKMTRGKVEEQRLVGKILMTELVEKDICIEYKMNGTNNIKLN